MNRDMLETQWPQIRGMLSEKFPNLTEDDIRQINGRYDQLVAKLQQKYGYSREEAEERIRSWNFDRMAGTREDMRTSPKYNRDEYRDTYNAKAETDNSTMYKWLLGLGIPLLLLAAYLFNSSMNEQANTPTATNQQMMMETPADRNVSESLRTVLFSRGDLVLDNVLITSHNGVVTLSGFVPDRQTRNEIDATVKEQPGVKQVVNNLQIR